MPKGTHGMSELELAILTPDERAALEDESTAEETAAQASQASGTMPGSDKDDETDIEVTAKAPAAAGDAEVIETKPPTADKPAAPAVQSDAAPETPAAIPEPFAARMPTVEAVDYAAQLAELAQKFEDGEVSTAEYNAQLIEIVGAKTKAELSVEFNQNLEAQLWERAKGAFFESHDQYTKSRPLFGALSAEISAIETERIEKQLPPLPGPSLLEQAHANVMREFGQVPPAATKTPTRAGQPPDLTKVPTTLAHVPPAAEPDTGKDRFAELDRLADTNPMEWERQLARLSPEDSAAYLASA